MLKRLLLVCALMSAPLLAYLLQLPFCPSAALFDFPCPGCGLTRACVALLQADLPAAMAFNPLAPLVCPMIAATVLWSAFNYVRRGSGRIPRWAVWPLVGSVVALQIVWLARMAFGVFGGPVPV